MDVCYCSYVHLGVNRQPVIPEKNILRGITVIFFFFFFSMCLTCYIMNTLVFQEISLCHVARLSWDCDDFGSCRNEKKKNAAVQGAAVALYLNPVIMELQ